MGVLIIEGEFCEDFFYVFYRVVDSFRGGWLLTHCVMARIEISVSNVVKTMANMTDVAAKFAYELDDC